ncbi:MAG: PhzF family phenazine biosynthesis protein [Pseudomonadota bacterium]
MTTEPRSFPTSIVDVFAERPLQGNQLAIVHDASSLTDAQMQAIALETNYSETTFITRSSQGEADVRIFTPTAELPFAGHPTVGTAWELTRGLGSITLNLKVGPVPVVFQDGVGWMIPPPVEFLEPLDRATAANLVELSEADLAEDLPVEIAQVGPKFVIIPVRSLQALRRARLSLDVHTALLSEDNPVLSAFVVCSEPYTEDADFATRMFFVAGGLREDPATGSANTAFAAYLRKHRGPLGDVVVDQGFEINRDSRLYLKVEDKIQVGGRVQPVFQGELRI